MIYVEDRALISPQEPFSDAWMECPHVLPAGLADCQDPDFRQYVPAAMLRRMPLAIKRAVASAFRILGGSVPEAVITGTGTGTMQSSEDFLMSIGELGESSLPPTPFINSTHNTLGSAVAIALKCKGYNMTYAHSALSFESALLDAWLRMRLGYNKEILLGAHEEIPGRYYDLMVAEGAFSPDCPVSSHSVTFLLSASRTVRSQAAVTGVFFGDIPENVSADILVCDDGNRVPESLAHIPQVSYRDIFGYSYSYGAVSVFCACALVSEGRAGKVAVYNEFRGQSTLVMVEALV